MRDLIILRGAPGAGKSTFARAQGLTAHVLSPDDFRLRLGGVTLTEDGEWTVSHEHEKRVWAEVEETLDFKMARGQLVVLDATFQRNRDFNMPLSLARRHAYRAVCVDFTTVPKELALERNRRREPWKIVPEQVIHTAYERFPKNRPPKGLKIWRHDALEGETAVLDRLEPSARDLSDYRAVMNIGDIQGCHAPLAELFPDGLQDDVFHVFIGDLLDRGIQNGEVIRWAMEHIHGAPNAVLLWGNHETHIQRYAQALEPVSREFAEETLPQIEAAGFTRDEANQLMAGVVDAFPYVFRGRKVMATHAGLPCVPERLARLPSELFWKGAGSYGSPVDEKFSEAMAEEGWIQVHGHRNPRELPVEAAPGSFNLEGQVEFGGALRVVTLESDGAITPREIANAVYRTTPPLSGPNARPKAPAADDGAGERGRLSAETLAKFESHPLVRVKSFASKPHLRSVNFTAKAFYDGKWDEVNGMARGLFVAEDRRIVARSYAKFFNLDERPETQRKALKAKLAFPARLWVKENGFLGILGWDHVEEQLLFCSKSTMEGTFAGWFREILSRELGEDGLKRAAEIVRRRNLSLVFEVNDPVRDPHMIDYDAAHVVLLDAVHRQEAFAKLPFDALGEVGAALGLRVKEAGPGFRDWKGFEGWLAATEAQGRYFQWKERHIEGFVVEAADGFQFKIKLPFYAFWKRMRSLRDKIRRSREKGAELAYQPLDEEAEAFRDWLIAKPDDWLERDVIALREAFWLETGRN